VCGGESEDLGCGCGVSGPSGCDNVCGSTEEIDECGVCGGPGSIYECGCTDIPSGYCDCNLGILDNDGNCDTDSSNDCLQDCFGIWGGDAQLDYCGYCNGNNVSCSDCNGDLNGSAYIDGCQNCVGGNTGLTPCPEDCNGIEGGNAYYDECGACVTQSDPNCELDCAGIWGGDADFDECGICNGVGISEGQCDCLGNVEDCFGICGGSASDLGCGCGQLGPSGCNNQCGSMAEIDYYNHLGLAAHNHNQDRLRFLHKYQNSPRRFLNNHTVLQKYPRHYKHHIHQNLHLLPKYRHNLIRN
jgi:hypothetical protein